MLQRVQKILSNRGFCSRREAEILIEKGVVKVNGSVITIGDKADSEKDDILVYDKPVQAQKRIYMMVNKPKGYLCTLNDPKKRKTIMDLVRIKERVFPIGRLDVNTEGLLLLTNDGDFANMMMHPRHGIEKTYIVTVKEPISEKDLVTLRTGVLLIDGKTSPAKVKVLNNERTKIEITIHEGKNRILRRMLNELGYYVIDLQRIKIAFIELKNLKKGRWKMMHPKDVEKLRALAQSYLNSKKILE